MPRRLRTPIYRLIFVLAGCYNIGFGLWSGYAPDSLFHRFDLVPPQLPYVWQALGVGIAVYGLGYFFVAWRLRAAQGLVLLGLVAKLIAPIIWAFAVTSGEWPARTFPIILFNDLIWWLPFGLFLMEGTRLGRFLRREAPMLAAIAHLLAGTALVFILRGGTEVVTSPEARAEYIVHHMVSWRIGWGIWILAGLSLVGFYAWWMVRVASHRWWLLFAFAIALAGLASDLLGEAILCSWLPGYLETMAPWGTWLTGAIGNGLYTVAGMILTCCSCAAMTRSLWRWSWAIWATGGGLTIATILRNVPGMVVANALLLILLCPWFIKMGREWRQRPCTNSA